MDEEKKDEVAMPDRLQMMGMIEIDYIILPDRLREIDEAWVEGLSKSIEEQGLNQPIVVRKAEGDQYILVAGAHRLEACKSLGWETIRGIISNLTDEQATLVEIDENLMRRELSFFDRIAFISARRNVWEGLHGKPKGGDRKSNNRDKNQSAMFALWSETTQEKTGLSRRSVEVALQIYNALTPETRDIVKGSWLAENGAQLKALAQSGDKLRQANAARMMVQEPDRFKTAQSAFDFISGLTESRTKTPQEKQLEALQQAWGMAPDSVKIQFIDWAGLRYAGHLKSVSQ